MASFDPTSTKIVLDQVPGHPVSLRERAEEDELVPDTSLYKDDGSLEVRSSHGVWYLANLSGFADSARFSL